VTTAEATPVSASPLTGRWWRDRGTLAVGAALLVVAALAWIDVVRQGMAGMAPAISLSDAAAFVGAWGVMMAAMMLPSALPMILLYRTVSQNMVRSGQQVAPTLVFAATYLVVWLLFGVPVYLFSAAVGYAVRLSDNLAGLLAYALAIVLVAAGAYQFTAIKRICLKNCQNPISFLMHRWRGGYGGTLRVGGSHALYCVGCCWGLMAVLVAAGAMGLNWVLLIAAIVFAEKLMPRGEWTARLVGAALVLLGVVVVVRPELAAVLRGQTMAM
jgi:predicted metal-binding membrane protein